MKKLLLLCAVLLTPTLRAANAPAIAPDANLAPLAQLVGGLWVADIPVPQGRPPLKIELRFSWSENKRAIRFDSAFVSEDRRKPYTSGLYAWDGAKGKLVIFYVGDGGEIVQGTITPNGDTLVNDLTATDPSGKVSPLKVELTMLSPDAFENAIFVMKDGDWTSLLTVKYVRQQ